jgi:hypothetical protein
LLPLSGGEAEPISPDAGSIVFRKPHDHVVHASKLCRRNNIFGVRLAKATYTFYYRSVEELDILGHIPEMLTMGVIGQVRNLGILQTDRSDLRRHSPYQMANQCRFPGTAWSDNCQHFTGLDLKVDLAKNNVVTDRV